MNEEVMRSLDEIGLVPTDIPSTIEHRSEINPFTNDNKLPVFVSPMTSVVNNTNHKLFEDNNFIPILPRTGEFEDRLKTSMYNWTSFSLSEFEKIVTEKHITKYVLVDIADGHIKKIFDLAKQYKNDNPESLLMIGNIDHPQMFVEACKAHVDYVREGIGGGSVCSTSVQCGVHVSHVWFINELKKYKEFVDGVDGFRTKLIADGGINTIDRAIKCIAMGFDYVMWGRLFAQCEEACGQVRSHILTHNGNDIYIEGNLTNLKYSGDIKKLVLERLYYGMASEQGQIDISGGCNKNPEGVATWVPVNNTLYKLSRKFEAALRSTMSYTFSYNLEELKQTKYKPMSDSEFKAYYDNKEEK